MEHAPSLEPHMADGVYSRFDPFTIEDLALEWHTGVWNYSVFDSINLEALDMSTPRVSPSLVYPSRGRPSPDMASPPPRESPSPLSRLLGLPTSPPLRATASICGDYADAIELDEDTATNVSQVTPAEVGVGAEASDGWRQNKERIKNLYMTQNMTLKDVIKIMTDEYMFTATTRMYKRQLEKWGWHKYNSRRQQRDVAAGRSILRRTGKACSRNVKKRSYVGQASMQRRALRLIQPRHANETYEVLDLAGRLCRDYLSDCSESDKKWKSTGELQLVLHPVTSSPMMVIGLKHFKAGDTVTGGRLLRRASRLLEAEMKQHHLSFLRSFLLLLDKLLDLASLELSCIILKHVYNLARLDASTQCLEPILDIFLRIFRHQSKEAGDILGRLIQVWIDRFRELRGANDYSTLRLVGDCLNMKVCKTESNGAVTDINAGYEHLLQVAVTKHGKDSSHLLDIEDEVLHLQYLSGEFLDDFTTRNEVLLRSVRDSVSQPLDDSRISFYGSILSNCYYRSFHYYAESGNTHEMLKCSRDYVYQGKSFVHEMDWVEDLLEMEEVLRRKGMEEEARALQMERLHSEFYQNLDREFADEEPRPLIVHGPIRGIVASQGGIGTSPWSNVFLLSEDNV